MVDAALGSLPAPGRRGVDGGDRGGGLALVPVPPFLTTPAITADLVSLERGLSDYTAAQMYELRDTKRVTILAGLIGLDYQGVAVVTLNRVNAGRVLDVLAIKFRPGRFARSIDQLITAVARRHGCAGVRFSSPRPLDRLWPDLTCIERTWWRAV